MNKLSKIGIAALLSLITLSTANAMNTEDVNVTGNTINTNLSPNINNLNHEGFNFSDEGKTLNLNSEVKSFDQISKNSQQLEKIIINKNFTTTEHKAFLNFLAKCNDDIIIDFTNSENSDILARIINSDKKVTIDNIEYKRKNISSSDDLYYIEANIPKGITTLSLSKEICQLGLEIQPLKIWNESKNIPLEKLELPVNCKLRGLFWELLSTSLKSNKKNIDITIDPNNSYYHYSEGVIYNKDQTEIFYIDTNVKTLNLSNSIKKIQLNFFYAYWDNFKPKLKEIKLSDDFNFNNKDKSIEEFLCINDVHEVSITGANDELKNFLNEKNPYRSNNKIILNMLHHGNEKIDYFLLKNNIDITGLYTYDDKKEINTISNETLSKMKQAIIIQLNNDHEKILDNKQKENLKQENIEENFLNEYIQIFKNKLTKAQRAKSIYNWITENIAYNYEHLIRGKRGKQDASTVFTHKWGVCEGYSRLSTVMMSLVDVPCIYASSYPDSANVAHAFNVIYIEDGNCSGWGLMDTTWGSYKKVNIWKDESDTNSEEYKNNRNRIISPENAKRKDDYFPEFQDGTLEKYNKKITLRGNSTDHKIQDTSIILNGSVDNYMNYDINVNTKVIKLTSTLNGKLIIPDFINNFINNLNYSIDLSDDLISNLEKLEISKHLKLIDGFNFYSIKTISVDEENQHYKYIEGVLYDKTNNNVLFIDCNVKVISLYNSIYIPQKTILQIETIKIGKHFKNDGLLTEFLLRCPKLKEINVDDKNQYYKCKDNVLYDENNEILYNDGITKLYLTKDTKCINTDILKLNKLETIYLDKYFNTLLYFVFCQENIHQRDDWFEFFNKCTNLKPTVLV